MDFRFFAHSWLSDWNNGNAHFLRGLADALQRRGHTVRAYESLDGVNGGWSLRQLREEAQGETSIRQMRSSFPGLDLRLYAAGGADPGELKRLACPLVTDWGAELRDAEWVLVHEWNPPALFEELLRWRQRWPYRVLLHDTHHRALSQPDTLRRLPLARLDGVLAFGESLRRIYERWGVARSYTLHEAADLRHFPGSPDDTQPAAAGGQGADDWDIAWIGNWGDEERTPELAEFLIAPVDGLKPRARACAFGVRYPAAAQERLTAAGFHFGGYLPNLEAPRVYARTRVAVHVPRQAYRGALAGIPTIRVFEALACGVPLLSAPWSDSEDLFHAGEDYWVARNGKEMEALLKQLLAAERQRKLLGAHGAATVAAHHTCAHRARELEAICHDWD